MLVTCVHGNGASNNENTGAGEVGTDASIRYAHYSYGRPAGESSGDLFVDMVGNTATTGGYLYTIMRRLKARGVRNLACLAITQGSSFWNDWDPSSVEGIDMLGHLVTMLANLKAEFPAASRWRHIFLRNQGTSDMRNASLQFQSGQPQGTVIGPYVVTEGTSYVGWDGGNELWYQAYIARIAAAGLGNDVRKMAVQQYTGITLQTYPAVPVVPRRQIVWVGGTPDPDTSKVGTHPRLIPTENAAAFEGDGVHGYKPPVTIDNVLYPGGGYQWMGEARIEPAIFTELAMGFLGTPAKAILINHVRNKATYSPAANHFLHLYSDAACTVPLTPGNAPGYAPVTKANDTTTWPAPSGRAVASGVAWDFPTPSGTWPDVRGWKLTDSATEGAGTLLAQHGLAVAVPVNVGTGPIGFAIGTITVSAATNVGVGGFANSVVHGFLGLMFGGTAYAPAWIATTHGCWFNGDPAGAGVAVGGRVALTQATTWNSAVGAMAVTATPVALAQQVTGTYWAEFDAGAGGNLIFSAPRPASVGATGTILAGQIQTSIQ